MLTTLSALAIAGLGIARDPVAVLRLLHSGLLRMEGAELAGSDGVILQRALYDCGPAALANLLLLVGHANPGVDTLAALAGTGPHGTTLNGLKAAARAFGLPLVRVTAGPRAGPMPSLPFIAWVDRDHFVVVASRLVNRRLMIIDPRVGRLIRDEQTFGRHWSGEALVVASSYTRARVPQ